MKTLSKLAAAASAVVLASGFGVAANAAPTPGPSDTPGPTVTLTPLPYPTTPVVSTVNGTPTTTTPTPSATPTMATPVGQFTVGTITYTMGADCRSITATASGWGTLPADLHVDFGTTGNTDQATGRGTPLVGGAATTTVTLEESDRPTGVDFYIVQHRADGTTFTLHEESFTPECVAQADGRRATVRPTIAYSVPGCTTTPDTTVRAQLAVTNNDTVTLEGGLRLWDATSGQIISLDRVGPFSYVRLQPGETGAFYVDLPRGFYGSLVYSIATNLPGGETPTWVDIAQVLNVEQCVPVTVATVTASNATCEAPVFTVLNPADGWKATAAYSYVMTDAAGRKTTGTLSVADGQTAQVTATAAAGLARLEVTNPDGVVSVGQTTVASCAPAPARVPGLPGLARTGR